MAHHSLQRAAFIWTDPFTARIREFPTPPDFKMHAKREYYDGSTDPLEHVYYFHDIMSLYGTPDEMMCRAFPSTLRGNARMWFAHLKPNTIDSFCALANAMCGFFAGSSRPHHHVEELGNIVQRKGESLRGYLKRFNNYAIGIPDLTGHEARQALRRGTASTLLSQTLMKQACTQEGTTVGEVFQMAIEVISMEEKMIAIGVEPLVK